MKTKGIKSRALDWAVAIAVGTDPIMRHDHLRAKAARNNRPQEELDWHLSTENNNPITVDEDGITKIIPYYHRNWAVSGHIIGRYGICLSSDHEDAGEGWIAHMPERDDKYWGETALEAAMRCLVASKLGDEVEVPDALL